MFTLMHRSKDEAFWERLLSEQAERNGREFYRLAFNILLNSGDAEDACQTAFMKAWEQRSMIRDGSALKYWLSRAVVKTSKMAEIGLRTFAHALARIGPRFLRTRVLDYSARRAIDVCRRAG